MQEPRQQSNSAQQLFVDFLEDFLQISFVGFQSGFGIQPDLILFTGPCGSTLAVPASIMHEPREKAREIIKAKVAASEAAFNRALDAESLKAVDRYWRASSRAARAVNETQIGKAINRRAASAGC